ncbi:hypothetical protein J7L70_02550 [Candidatus Bathyarchaeota archaeon]|nr:hypothetical protein [Candidatus Bathyarchaeota archaeon]
MFKLFETQEDRLRLLNMLRTSGYKVRMHAYEYFVRNRYFVAFIHLMPSNRLAVIRGFRWNLKEFEDNVERLKSLIKRIDPNIKVEVQVD